MSRFSSQPEHLDEFNSPYRSVRKNLSLIGRVKLGIKKKFSPQYGRVYLESALNWTKGDQLIVQGESVTKRQIIFNRLLERDGLSWKSGGYAFVRMQRAIQIQDALERQNIPVDVHMLSDVCEGKFSMETLSVLPTGRVTIFVADDYPDSTISRMAINSIIVNLVDQVGGSVSMDGRHEKRNHSVGNGDRTRLLIPMVFEDLVSSYQSTPFYLSLFRNVFSLVHFNSLPLVSTRSGREEYSETDYLVANAVGILYLDESDFSKCSVKMHKRCIIKSHELAEAAHGFPGEDRNYSAEDLYNVALCVNDVLLTVDLRRPVIAAA